MPDNQTTHQPIKVRLDRSSTDDQLSVTVRCGGMVVARVIGPWDAAEREAAHYARMYAPEGPVKIIRRPVKPKHVKETPSWLKTKPHRRG